MANPSAIFELSSYPKASGNFSMQPFCGLHLHRHIEFACILSGSVEVDVRGEKRVLSNGDSVFITPYTPHSYNPLVENSERFVLVFEPEYLGSLGEILLKNRPEVPFIDGEIMNHEFSPLRDTLYTILRNVVHADADTLSYAQAFSKLVFFFGNLLSITQLTENDTARNKLYLKSISLSNAQYTDPQFDIEAAAQQLHVSTSRIQQLFSEHMNISFKKYLTLLRVSKAKELLKDSAMPIAEVAGASGFNSVRTFNRIFRAHREVSPLEYRKFYSE